MSFFSMYLRNIIAGSTCNVRSIQTIDSRQIILSVALQIGFVICLPPPLALEVTICLVLAYLISIASNFRRTQVLSIFPPVACSLTLIVPALSGIDLLFDTDVAALIGCFPILFKYVDDKVIAHETSIAATTQDSFFSNPDSRMHGLAALNQAKSMEYMDESVLVLMRTERPKELGPTIGAYCDAPIYGWIRTVDGSYYDFELALPKGVKYGFPANNRIVIPPGLMYVKRGFLDGTT